MVSFSSVPQQPPTGLNAEAARLQQRRLDDQADRATRPHHLRAAAPESLHRMVARVRTAMRAHRSTR